MREQAGRKRARPVRSTQLGIEWVDDYRVPTIAAARQIMAAGIEPPGCAAEAAAVLEWLDGRDGLATPAQARTLRRYGCRDDLTRDEAGEVMGILAAHGWRDTHALRAAVREWTA